MNEPKNAFETSGSSPGLSQAEILFLRLTSHQNADGPATELRITQRVKTHSRVDFSLENHGSIFLLRPLTAPAFQWVEDHISREGFQPYWPNVVIEHRYVESVVDGITADGLEVA